MGDETPELVKEDMSALLGAAMPFAEEMLGAHGEFYPYAVAVTGEGEITQLAVYMEEEHPDTVAMLEGLYEVGRQRSAELRAVAFVCNVGTKSGNAVRVEIEHREGETMAAFAPYKIGRFRKSVTFGEVVAKESVTRIWSQTT